MRTVPTAIKEFVRRHFPRSFLFARGVKDQLVIEARVLRQAGLQVLVDRVGARSTDWRKQLPFQRPRRLTLSTDPDPQRILDWARRTTLPIAQGGHTVYLPPSTFQQSDFRDLALQYPGDAGLKVLKNLGSASKGEYLHGRQHGYFLRKLTYPHTHLSLVSAALHLQGLGPRLYDLLELEYDGQARAAYVVSHCPGRTPDHAEWKRGISDLRRLQARKFLRVTVPQGFDHVDFAAPDCSGNCMVDRTSGRFQYLDFQNFVLLDYGRFLKDLARKAAAETHFGDQSLLRGGRYLYQSIPGITLPAKRKINVRAGVMSSLLETTGLSVSDRLVLDIGCNLGMLMAQYLAWGAYWCHGWDMGNVVTHTERLLLALGCTRFSLTGTTLSSNQPLEPEIPEFARRSLDGCVISYMAIRGHIGWLAALSKIRWGFMIYEGHEGESEQMFAEHIAQLQRIVSTRIVAQRSYEDGDSTRRLMAILVRDS